MTSVSVLLPSRGRPRALVDSIDGLMRRADHPKDIEVLVALDPDDSTADDIPPPPPEVKLLMMGERYGYAGLHHYVNRLAQAAQGRWLMLWNDDAVMCTDHWDAVVIAQPDGVLFPHTNHPCGDGWCCNVFPIWPAAWTKLVGHVALNAHCDSWIQEVGDRLGGNRHVPIEVIHDRFDLTGNNEDLTYGEREYTKDHYYAQEMAEARLADASRINTELLSG